MAKKPLDDMTGIVFAEEVEEGSKRPNWTGKLVVHGEELRVALWDRISSNGDPYMTINVSIPRTDTRRGGSDRPQPQRSSHHRPSPREEPARPASEPEVSEPVEDNLPF